MYMPKSAKPVSSSSAYMPKSARPVGQSQPKQQSGDWTSAAQPGAEESFAGGFLQRAIAGLINMTPAGQRAQKAQAGEVESVRRLQEAAMNEQDPQKRAQYQALADEAQKASQANLSGRKSQLLGNTGWSAEEANRYQKSDAEYLGAIGRDSLQGAVDIGSVMYNPGNVVSPNSVVGRIANSTVRGAAGGTLSGIGRATQADSIQEGATDIGTGAAMGAATGAVVQTGIEGVKGAGHAAKALWNSRGATAVKESTKNIAKNTKGVFLHDPDAATNEIMGYSKNKRIIGKAMDKNIDITKKTREMWDEVGGASREEISKNIDAAKTSRAKQIESALLKKDKKINLNDLVIDDKGTKMSSAVKEMIKREKDYGNPTTAKQIEKMWKMVKKDLTPSEAWKMKTDFYNTLYTAAGKEKNVAPLSSGNAQLRELIADALLKDMHSDKVVGKALTDYEALILMGESVGNQLKGVDGIPTASINIFDQMIKAAQSGQKSPATLNKVIESYPENQKQSLLKEIISMIGGAPGSVKNSQLVEQLTKQRQFPQNIPQSQRLETFARPNIPGARTTYVMGQSAIDRASSQNRQEKR